MNANIQIIYLLAGYDSNFMNRIPLFNMLHLTVDWVHDTSLTTW